MIMMTSISSSQTDIPPIVLPQKTVKEIIKDLIEGDAAKEENFLLRKQILLYDLKFTYSDSLISSLQSKNEIQDLIITKRENQISLLSDENSDLLSDLKKQKLTSKIYQSATLVAVLGGLIYIISISK